jgi:hypothetical protein
MLKELFIAILNAFDISTRVKADWQINKQKNWRIAKRHNGKYMQRREKERQKVNRIRGGKYDNN